MNIQQGKNTFSKYRARKPGTSPYIVVVVRADHPLIIGLFRREESLMIAKFDRQNPFY